MKLHSFLRLCIYSCLMYMPFITPMATKMYKPESKLPEPRIIRPGIAQCEITYALGSTEKAFDNLGKPTNIMQLFGTENLVVGLLPESVVKNLPPEFINILGSSEFKGKFEFNELVFEAYKHFHNGFFIEAAWLIHDLRVKNITFTTQFDATIPTSLQNTLSQDFKQALSQTEGLTSQGYAQKNGLLHAYALIGWGTHINHLVDCDFIDINIKTGLSFPQLNDNYKSHLLFIPLDENYHIGIPLIAQCAVGFFDWITVGITSVTTFWLPEVNTFHMTPFSNLDTTMLSPTKGMAVKTQKPFLHASAYIKADHLFKGFSTKLGYSWTHKQHSRFKPYDPSTFPPNIVNRANYADGWKATSLFLELEYDFATHKHPKAPALSFRYSRHLSGQYIFTTPSFGANITMTMLF